jgi:PEP-CTERM motif
LTRYFKSLCPFFPLILIISTGSVLSADSIVGGSITFTNQALPLNTTGSINQFNTSLGTLTGIEFVVTGGSMAGTVTDQFTGTPSQPTQTGVMVTMAGDLYIFDPSNISNDLSDTYMTATITGQTILNNGTLNTFSGLSTTGNTSDTTDTTSDFTPFEGTGTLNLGYEVTAGTAFANSAGHALVLDNPSTASVSGTTSGSFEVIYLFNDVTSTPEPASLVMMGGSLLGLAYLIRRGLKKHLS